MLESGDSKKEISPCAQEAHRPVGSRDEWSGKAQEFQLFCNHSMRALGFYALISQLKCSPVELKVSPAKTTTSQWRAKEINDASLTLCRR